MAKANDTWRVLPHGPLEKLAENLFRVEGALDGGPPLKRVMTIAKRASDGSLVIHNGIALDEDAMREIDRFGEVRTLIVPNGYHRLDAKVFADRYPKARVLCPEGARKKVAEVVGVAGNYSDFGADASVSFETLDGTNEAEGVMIVRSNDGVTLVFNDAVFNMPHLPGVKGFVLKHLTGSSGGPKITNIVRWFIIKDKAAFGAHLARLARTPDLVRIIVSHHETIVKDAGKTLASVAAQV